MADRPDNTPQSKGRAAKRQSHLKLVPIDEVFDDDGLAMPWDVDASVVDASTEFEPLSFRNKYGLTMKQEKFCVAMLRGVATQSDAYREAYDCERMSAPSIHVEACLLMQNPKIAQRLDAGYAEKEKGEQHTRASLRDFVVEGLRAEAANATSDAARVQAYVALGKTIAMFTDKVEQAAVDERTPDQIKADLERMLVEMYGEVLP